MPTLSQIRADIASNFSRDMKITMVEGAEIKEVTELPDRERFEVMEISPRVTCEPAWMIATAAAFKIAKAETRSEAMDGLALLAGVMGPLHSVSRAREVMMHDCPHCKGPMPTGLDPEPEAEKHDA